MGTFENISNSPQMLSRLFGQLKYFIEFKCPNSNTYDLIQKIQNVLEKSAPFFPRVLAQSRNDEHFVKGILGSLKIFHCDPSWISFGARVWAIPISNSFET